MLDTFLSFLGHGGFKLLIIAFFVIANFAKVSAKDRKKREVKLRGSTKISDFSAPQQFPVPTAQANPVSKPVNSTLGSPWSNNQNPFDS